MAVKKVLIVGGTGRLGLVLSRVLKENGYEAISIGSNKLNLQDENVQTELMKYSPDYIVHAAALSSVDRCEREPDLAYSINGYGTEKVSLAAKRMNVLLLYISTDYVFDGENPPYSENDKANPLSVYGKSKLLGEQFAREICSSVILRVSWLFGPEGNDFVDFVAHGVGTLRVVPYQVSKPTCTVDLSYAIMKIIQKKATGIYHFANPPTVSRLDWVRTILMMSGKDRKIRRVDWEELGVDAERPLDSSLSTSKYEREFGKIPSWREGLRECLNA
ncbi:MAG: dTDP-4-dehydrorhamnose reductase [candidate division WOR-3 bacterium]|nr:dTDP-4-dehydrorhamnose reductase [candidate division WOR-3 bacterium]